MRERNMQSKAQKSEQIFIIENPKEIRDAIIKELNAEARKRRRELEEDVMRLQDAMRGPN